MQYCLEFPKQYHSKELSQLVLCRQERTGIYLYARSADSCYYFLFMDIEPQPNSTTYSKAIPCSLFLLRHMGKYN